METGLTRCKEVWMCGFQGTRNRRRSAYCAESFQDGGFGYKVTKLKPRKRRTAQTLHRFPVTMAKGIHLFPYRTQKLSLSAPMVLGWRRPGRVGRCRIPQRKASDECLGLFLCVSGFVYPEKSFFQIIFDEVRERTWLGFFLPPAVRDAGRKNHLGEWEGERRRNLLHNVVFYQAENVLGSVQPCAPPVGETLLPHLTCAVDGVMIGIF